MSPGRDDPRSVACGWVTTSRALACRVSCCFTLSCALLLFPSHIFLRRARWNGQRVDSIGHWGIEHWAALHPFPYHRKYMAFLDTLHLICMSYSLTYVLQISARAGPALIPFSHLPFPPPLATLPASGIPSAQPFSTISLPPGLSLQFTTTTPTAAAAALSPRSRRTAPAITTSTWTRDWTGAETEDSVSCCS